MNKKYRWLLLVGGVLAILAGIYMIASPASSLASLTFFFAIVMFVSGIAESIHFFSSKNEKGGMALVSGIINILLALCLFSSSWLGLVAFIPYLFAFWVLVSGFTKLFFSFSERKNNNKNANMLLFTGILGIIAGFILLAHPFFTGVMVAYMIGFSFIWQGVSSFILYSKLGKEAA